MTASTDELAAIKTQQAEDARRHSQSLVAAKSALDEVRESLMIDLGRRVTDNPSHGIRCWPTSNANKEQTTSYVAHFKSLRAATRSGADPQRERGEAMGAYSQARASMLTPQLHQRTAFVIRCLRYTSKYGIFLLVCGTFLYAGATDGRGQTKAGRRTSDEAPRTASEDRRGAAPAHEATERARR